MEIDRFERIDGNEINISGIHMQWLPEKGTCLFEKLPATMMWVDTTLAGMMSGFQTMVGPKRFNLALQSEGRKSVEADWEIISQYTMFQDGFRAIAKRAAVAGWGEWELLSINTEKQEATFRVKNNWEGLYQKSLGVCWGSGMLAGKFAGYCSKLFNTNCWAAQVSFIARGDASDEFIVRPSLKSTEREIENLMSSDEATQADIAVAFQELDKKIRDRKRALQELQAAYEQLAAAEAQLQISEKKYRDLYQNIRDGSAAVDMEGKIIDFNMAFQLMLGYTAEELYSLTYRDITPVKWHSEEEIILKDEILKRGYSDIYEKEYRRKDGTIFPVELRTYLMRDETGNPTGMWAFVRDITERKKAEYALNESERQLHSIIQGSPIPTFVIRRDHTVIYWNRALEEMSGINAENIIGTRNHWKAFYQNERPCMADLLIDENIEAIPHWYKDRYSKSKLIDEAYETTDYFPNLGGDGKWLRLTAAMIRNSQGNMVGAVETLQDVTEHKQALDELRESKQQLSDIINFLPDSTFVIDKSGKVIAWNRAIEEMTGIKAAEIIGKGDYEYAIPFYGERRPILIDLVLSPDKEIEAKYEHADCDGTILSGEAYMPALKGGEAYLFGKASLLHNSRGEIVGAIESIRDVTFNKKIEEALRESEQKYRLVVENAWEAIVIIQDGLLKFANQGALKIAGYKEPLSPRPFLEFIHPEDREEIFERYMKRIKGENSPDVYTCRIIGENNTIKWVEIHVVRVTWEGRPANLVFFSDITERERAAEALKESEEKYRLTIENTAEAIFIVQDGIIKFSNESTKKHLGYSDEELKNIPVFHHIHPDDRAMVQERYKRRMKGERGINNYEVRIVSRTGEIFHTQTSVVLITWDGRSAELVCSRDVTETKKLETQLQRAQKMEAIGTLAGGIAHDFNNILGAILGYAEIALTDNNLDNRLRHYINQIFRAGERARDLVKQILAFSRQSDEEPRAIRVSPIVMEVMRLLRASLPSTIKIRQDIKAEPDTILADPIQIHQILMNLCTNAAHAMRDKKGVLSISLHPVEISALDVFSIHQELTSGMYLKLTVTDTGHGIEPMLIDRIFDPFFTTKVQGEGTGMGLSVVHGIVKRYNGAITVESKVGKGTEFNIYLPLLTGSENDQEVKGIELRHGEEEHILFVDDEEDLVKLGGDILTKLGYKVEGRTNSMDALEYFRTKPAKFDLVITDMTMPNMTGIELAQEIMRIRPDIPIILCTGFSESITQEKAKALGVKEFIMKPFIIQQLAEIIRRVLDKND